MKARYRSLDVFRGATVCLMILVNNPGTWAHIYPPLEHAAWHGLTPTDLVFPFFLFSVGNAMAFVLPRIKENGDVIFWRKIIKRSLIIFGIGLFLNWYPFLRWYNGSLEFINWVNIHDNSKGVRIFGVLQRIAVCYFFASIISYYLKPRVAYITALMMLMLYWIICLLGNPVDPYGLEGWCGTNMDKLILHIPHMYKGEGVAFDPEGILSTLSAITQVVFGFLVGSYIRSYNAAVQKENLYKMLVSLFVLATALIVTGFCWDMVFPINKKIWTSSFTIYTTGLAIMTFCVMIYFIELKQYKSFPVKFFEVFGKNALFIFALSAFLPKTAGLFTSKEGVNFWNWLYMDIFKHLPGDPRAGSLAYAICVIIFMWAICWWLDKKKIYIKV